jgi:hypothetical protein
MAYMLVRHNQEVFISDRPFGKSDVEIVFSLNYEVLLDLK